jgi:hypothetical protein
MNCVDSSMESNLYVDPVISKLLHLSNERDQVVSAADGTSLFGKQV